MGLPQQQGAFSTLRLTSPVQETSKSHRILRPHTVHSKTGNIDPSLKVRKGTLKYVLALTT